MGLGYKAAHQLLDLGLSHLILAVRSSQRGEQAAERLRQIYPKASIEVWQLDMKSYDSIQAFSSRVKSQFPRVAIVILNAEVGRMNFNPVHLTSHEETMQVNYLSAMLLVLLLLPILKIKVPTGSPPVPLTIVSAALTLAAKFPNKNANPLLSSFDDPRHSTPRSIIIHPS